MVKACLVCGLVNYIRMLPTGQLGRVCEGCQVKAMSTAIDTEDRKNSLKEIMERA